MMRYQSTGNDITALTDGLALGDRPLVELSQLACEKRDAYYGRTVTYSPKVFIPLTQLCRDVCHYCTFAKSPSKLSSPYMIIEEVIQSALRGVSAGCREALLTLGEKPELRYAAARLWLDEQGYDSTVAYLTEACRQLSNETALLPHVNAGNLTDDELRKLRPYMASMGIMLESSAANVLAKGGAHYGSPDKAPWRRWRTLGRAGRHKIPTTTGLLIGIGETRRDRIRDLLAIKRLHRRFGHIQEVIIQNFCPKPGTKMANSPEPAVAEHLWTIAMARLILPVEVSVQAPPNLRAGGEAALLSSGINDWGGISPVTQDFVNPEAPWPALEQLAATTAQNNQLLQPRLPVYHRYLQDPEWLHPDVRLRCLDTVDASGWLRTEAWRAGLVNEVPGISAASIGTIDPVLTKLLARRDAGQEISQRELCRLFTARGVDADAVFEAANALRQRQVGDSVTYVVNRNINYTNVCQYTCNFCAFSKGLPGEGQRENPYDISANELDRRCREARDLGATEVCLQGGIHPAYDGTTYLSIIKAVKQATPELHIHAFSPLELTHGANTLGLSVSEYVHALKAAGLNTVPGTAAEILDDGIRALICPDKLTTSAWLDTMRVVHEAGLRSTATILFGHVEAPQHWAAHLAAVRALQLETGGFTEFVPLPFVAAGSPIYRRGQSRPGPTYVESLLMHAVARIGLGDVLPNIQVSWVKMGLAGAQDCLRVGANDLGGTLMNESISRAAGAAHGQCLDPMQARQLAVAIGRKPRQRNTVYGQLDAAQRLLPTQIPMIVSDTLNEQAGKRARIKCQEM